MSSRLTKEARIERDKDIIKLRKEKLSYEAIALRTGLTRGGVATAVHRLKYLIIPPQPAKLKGHKPNCQCFICKRKREILGVCSVCLGGLKRIRWNRECDIAACDDPLCQFYRRPQKIIAKDEALG